MIGRITDLFRLARLTKNPFQGVLFFSWGMILPFKKKISFLKLLSVKIYFSWKGREFFYFIQDSTDIAVLREVFTEEQYKADFTFTPKVIIDLGANTGASALYFALEFPSAFIHAFEPDPRTIERLALNVGQFKNIIIHKKAVAGKEGKIMFYPHSESSISSSLIKREEHTVGVEVSGVTFDSVVEEYIPDVVKFDIEGGEYEVFSESTKINNIKVYLGEYHADLTKKEISSFTSLFSFFEVYASPVGKKPQPTRYLLRMVQKGI